MGTETPEYQLGLGPSYIPALGFDGRWHHPQPPSPLLAFSTVAFPAPLAVKGWLCDPIWPIRRKQRFSEGLLGNFCSPD